MRLPSVPVAAALILLAVPLASAQTAAPATPATPPAATAAPSAAAPRPAILDINSAAKEELDVLPQIGPARAEAIIKGRPYRAKTDLVTKKIIPQNAYDAIKDRIIAHQKS